MKKYILTYGLVALLSLTIAGVFSAARAQNYTFNADLSIGASGQDVVNLQSWLIASGFDIPAVSAGVTSKGYFGMQTKNAVAAYQRSVGLPAYGYFGPMTRARLGGGGYGGNSFMVTSPNGGEVWQRGTVHTITWSGASGLLGQKADIRLEFPTPACAQPGQPIRCMILVRAPYLIMQNVDLGTGSYQWIVGNVLGASVGGAGSSVFSSDLNNVVADGQYKVQICPVGGSSCDESDANLTITSSPVSTGNAPVINGIDAPTSLTVNQIGVWSIHATDPRNSTLSYTVDWGDASSNIPPGYVASQSAPQYTQSTTFSHAYATSGTYTVRVTVKNSSGLSAQTSATVTVTGANTAGPLRITSPNGGEIFTKGTTQNITWTSPYYFRATTVDLKLMQYLQPCAPNMMCAMVMPQPYTIASGIPVNQNLYAWNVGAVTSNFNVSDGQYTVQICESGTTNCDVSDAPFTVSATQTSSLPDVNVITPNSAAQWNVGTIQPVTINVTGDPTKVGNTINVYLVDSNNAQTYLANTTNYGTGLKAVSVNVPYVPYGYYRIYATLFQGSQMQAYDYSDTFTIMSQLRYGQCPAGYSCTMNH